ncbi:MAG: outer membrane protein assembly factor BamE [Gammaproteobacteria bacterium]|jgi:outer membrane protein assembly factor BamE|tara:strand:+ start:837 stop:1214 length:378 start_codon:yes stop_codon:yes gene_type:complete
MRTFYANDAAKRNTKLMTPLNLKRPIALCLLGILLSGCVYHVDIQQGNKLAAVDIEQVKMGMTQSQVRYLLGTPVIQESFHEDRWDYMYYFLPGRAKEADQRWTIILFEDGRVSDIELDVPVNPS